MLLYISMFDFNVLSEVWGPPIKIKDASIPVGVSSSHTSKCKEEHRDFPIDFVRFKQLIVELFTHVHR